MKIKLNHISSEKVEAITNIADEIFKLEGKHIRKAYKAEAETLSRLLVKYSSTKNYTIKLNAEYTFAYTKSENLGTCGYSDCYRKVYIETLTVTKITDKRIYYSENGFIAIDSVLAVIDND